MIPALIKKCVDAGRPGDDKVDVWGTGRASREYLYVDDAAEAIVLAAEHHDGTEPINLGTDHEVTIRETVETIARSSASTATWSGIPTKPDGQPRRRVRRLPGRARARLAGARCPSRRACGAPIDWYLAHRDEADRDPRLTFTPGRTASPSTGRCASVFTCAHSWRQQLSPGTRASIASAPRNASPTMRPNDVGEDRRLDLGAEGVSDRARRQMHGIFVGEIQALEGAGRTAFDYSTDECRAR